MLTPREVSVAALVAEGLTDKQIAGQLGIAENTVGNHITHITEALQLNRQRNVRVQIARIVLLQVA